jgi:hypothetical protein
MKRLLVRSSLFLFFVYAISLVLSWTYTNLFQCYKPNHSKINWTLLRKGDNNDYAVLGSSRVYHMIDVTLLNKLTNKRGINLATSGSSYADNYALLTKYLEHNKIKTLVLNADEFCFASSLHYSYPFSDYAYMPYFFEDSIHDVYRDNVPLWKYYLWTGIPLSRYIEFNEHYELSALLWFNRRGNKVVCDFDNTGSELLLDMKHHQFSPKDTAMTDRQTLNVDRKDESYFYKIQALCKAKSIQLILITSPIYCKGIYAVKNREKTQQYIEHLAYKERLLYVNFYGAVKLQKTYYFRDMTHTNVEGTRIYTRYLGDHLKGHL